MDGGVKPREGAVVSVLIQHLKQEHRMISRALDLFEIFAGQIRNGEHVDEAKLRMLPFVLHKLVEETHHKKENILFEALSELQSLPGGPRCSYFMDLRLSPSRFQDIIDKVKETSGPDSHHFQGISRDGRSSPLDIPLEEHHLGSLILMRIDAEIASPIEKRTHDLAALIEAYVELMRQHIDKEDTCLFEMANQLLSIESQKALLDRCHALFGDDTISTAGPTFTQTLASVLQEVENSVATPKKQPRYA